MDNLNSTESNSANDAASPVQENNNPSIGAQRFDIKEFISWQMVKDFFDFKIMIIPIIIKWIYLLVLVLLIPATFYTSFQISKYFGIFLWPLFFLTGVIAWHMFFELVMLGFAMIDVQREIRNELIELNRNK
jgi:hypothetical protein